MSYYNTVEIDRDELRELRRKAKESRNLKERLEREREKRKSDISRIRNEFNKKLNELKRLNKNLSSELKELNEELINTKKDLKEDIKKNREKINNIISKINQEKKEKKELALYWINNLNSQIDMIKKLDHEKFKPNELNRILTQIELAKKNYESGMFEAAISSLQERYIDAVELFEEVLSLEKEFNELKEEALKKIDEILNLLNAQKEVEIEVEGQKVEVDVNYWTNNRLDEIKKEAELLKKKIEDKKTTTKELKEIIEKEENLIEELKNIHNKAIDNLFLYQSRIDSANDIIDILDELGYEAVDDAMLSNDKRKSLFVKFENENEEEILVILSPKDNKNRLNILFDIETTNPKFKELRLQRILSELNKKGIKTENFSCTDNENPRSLMNEFKDFEKVKEGRVEEKVKALK